MAVYEQYFCGNGACESGGYPQHYNRRRAAHQHLFLCGYLAEQVLGNLFFDKGFISANHFTVERGFSTPTLGEAELKRKILTISKEKIMLLDYTKFGDDSMVLIASPENVDILITDWHAPEELTSGFGDKGVKTIIAPQV